MRLARAARSALLIAFCSGTVAQTGQEKQAPEALPPAPQAAVKAEPPADQLRMYRIHCRITETDAAGKTELIARPQVMTIEGQPALIQVGANITPPHALAPVDDLFSGNLAKILVRRGKNQLLVLDASIEMCRDQHAPGNRLRVTTTGVRVIEPITLGQAFAVSLPGDVGKLALRCEFTVFDATSEMKEAAARPPIRR